MAAAFQPEEFGHYRLTHLLGKGGMASVYRATREGPWGFAKQVALKRLHSSLNENQGILKALINEARIGGQLKHANIVEVYEFNKVRVAGVDAYYLAMEFVDGWTLDKVLKLSRDFVEPIPLEVALDIVIQTCAGLHYAHTLETIEGEKVRLVHRDIKPANLIVARDGVAKVMDFGIAKATTNLYHTTLAGETTKGTPHYMSPEQVAGDPDLDARSDIFALGSLIYELVTGKLLFKGDSLVSVLFAVAKAQVAQQLAELDGYAPGLTRIVAQCLSKDPAARYGSAEQLAEDLRAVASDAGGRVTLRGYLHTLRSHILARDTTLQDDRATIADERGPAFATLLGPDWIDEAEAENTQQLDAAREVADDLIEEIASLRRGPEAVAGDDRVDVFDETDQVDALSELQMTAGKPAQLSPRSERAQLSIPGDAVPDAETAVGPATSFTGEQAVDRTRDFPPASAPADGPEQSTLRLVAALVLVGILGIVGILFLLPSGDPGPRATTDDASSDAAATLDLGQLPDLATETEPAATPAPRVDPTPARTPPPRGEPTPARATPAPTPEPVAAASTPAPAAESTPADLPVLGPGPPPAGEVTERATPAPQSPTTVVNGKPGQLNVKRAPTALMVFVDGEKIGETPIFGYSLPPGLHTVRFKDKASLEYSPTKRVTVPAGGRVTIGYYDFSRRTWKD